MPTYAYVGRNQFNQEVRGELTAASREQLESLLRRQQITLLNAREKGPRHCPAKTSWRQCQFEGVGHLYPSVLRDD